MIANLLRGFCLSSLLILTNSTITIAQSINDNIEIQFTEAEIEWLGENPIIRASNYTQWPPIDFAENGIAQGFSVDYLNLVAEKLGIEIEYITSDDWSHILEMGKSKEIDVIHSISNVGDRAKNWLFTDPYLIFLVTYYGKIGTQKVNSPDDLINKKVGVVSGWSNHSTFELHYPEIDIVEFDTVKAALIGLSAGEVDIFADRLITSNYIISKNFITGLEVVGEGILPKNDQQDNIRMAVRNDWPILRDILNKGMGLISDQEYVGLAEKWQTNVKILNGIGLSAEEKQWLAENNVINVASEYNQAPISQVDENGEIGGIAGGYLEKIAQKLNVTFKWSKNKNWADGLEQFKRGDADMVSIVTPTVNRSEYMSFSDTYVDMYQMIYSNVSNRSFNNMGSLSGFRIGQVRSYAINDDIRKNYPDIEIIEVDSTEEALELLNNGDVDAHIGVIPVTANRILENNLNNLIVTGETPFKLENAFGVQQGQPLLLSSINKALQSITPIEKAELSRSFYSIKNEKSDTELVTLLYIVSGLLIAAFLYWAYTLTKEITKRKKIENELQKSKAESEAANTAKSTFLANMSHEIRTPLNAIIGFSDVISSGVFGKLKQQKYVEYLLDIKNSGNRLAFVINDILDLSKIEAGKWQLREEDFDLDRLIDMTIKKFENKIIEKNIEVSFQKIPENDDFAIIADEGCLKRVFESLLSNAIKFTLEGGKISCRLSKEKDNSYQLTIIDSGVGIEKDRINDVLSPFGQDYKLKSLNRTGTGLGLSIVDQFIKLHGGDFSLKSELNIGTCATVKFPPDRATV